MKKIYSVSLKLFALHALFFGVAIGIYHLLVSIIFQVEKLFDILLITAIFNVVALVVSFVFAVKIVRKDNNELFEGRHRLILFFYVFNIFLLILLIFIFLMIFKDWFIGIFLFGSCLLSLYIYYYFLRLIYYISFFGKPRKTAIVFVIILTAGYFAVLFLPQSNYKKVYDETEVKTGFTYFYSLDLEEIVGKKNLKDKNSAREITELIKLTASDEKFLNEGEVLPYILPTEVELKLLSDIAGNRYLSFSEEYLPGEIRKIGSRIIAPLNDLRAFSRGAVKLAERKRTEGSEDEAVNILSNLLLVGNQMLDADNDSLTTRLVGMSMARAGLDGLLRIYENDISKIEAITNKQKEMDNMRDGNRLLQSAVFHMNDEIMGSSKNTAIFFKHFAAQKHNIGGDFDERMAINYNSHLSGYIANDVEDLERFILSIMVLPAIVPFELNVGNNYVIYREIKKIAQESEYEILKYYLENSCADFIKKIEENRKMAESISFNIFHN